MYKLFKCITFLILLFLAFFTKAADVERWHWHDKIFKNYSVAQGQPHGAINTICEDKLGFVWLVTTHGLVRFDGTNFENVPTTVNDENFSISGMVADPNGIMWMSTSIGLMRFDPYTRNFKSIKLFANQLPAVGKISIETKDNTSFIWIASEIGVFKFNTMDQTSELYFEKLYLANPNLRIFSILNAKNHTVWIGTSQGLYYKQVDEATFSSFDLTAFLPNSLRISALLQTSDESIFVATPQNGLLKIDSTLVVTQAFATKEWLYALAEISPGVIWLGSFGRGVVELDLAKNSSQRMRHNRLIDTSLANDEIWQIYPARNGLIWLATNKGLSSYNPKKRALKTIYGDVGHVNGLSDMNVNSVVEDNTGNIWLGLREKGVDVINAQTGLLTNIGVDAENPNNALPGGAVEVLSVKTSNNNFIGSNWGIYQYWQSKLQKLDTGERNNSIYTGALYFNDSYLWAGGTDGLWRFRVDKNQLTQSKKINTSTNKLTDQRISVIGEGRNNEILVGTWRGINWLDETGKVIYQLPQAEQSNIRFDHFISSFFYDQHDRLWIGTEGDGIFVSQDKDHPVNFIQIDIKQGLSSNVVRAMQSDKYGRVWVSSVAGIDVIDIDNFAVTPLSAHDGKLFAPYYGQAAIETSASEIVFGGSGGITIIEPSLWQPDNSFAPLVIIHSVVGGQTYSGALLTQDNASPLIVPAENNKITIEFTSLDFINSQLINYRYRLLGLSSQWIMTDAEHKIAAYTTLPPGNYQLEIQNTNHLGHWNEQSKILHFEVLAFWYQTLIAKILLGVVILVLIGLFIRLRTSSLHKRKVFLEEQVKRRTLVLEQTTKALEIKTQALEQVSVTDPLTGINNRRFLDRNMPAEIALTHRKYHKLPADKLAIEGADLIFFLIDIDYFKKVNDQYGHQAGDAVLIEFTQRLKKIARESDYLIRWGGEEFLFVVRETSRDLATKLAARICQNIKQKPFIINQNIEISLSCSVGFVPFPFCGHNPEEVSWLDCIDIADKALYTAKNAGRDTWVGTTLKQPLSAKSTAIDVLNLPLSIIDLESNLSQSQVNDTWEKIHKSNG